MTAVYATRKVQYLIIAVGLVTLAYLSLGTCFADVTVQRLVKSGGIGGFGGFDTNQKMMVSGDKECTTGITKFSGRFSSLMNKGAKEATSITRLDKEVIWNLNGEKKTYTELTFQQMRDMMKSFTTLNPMQADSLRKAMATLSETVDVNRTGEKKTIAGLETERVIISLQGVHLDSLSKITDTTWVKNDVWMAPADKVPAELRDFELKMADKMGLSEGGPMAGFLNQYADAFRKLSDKLRELKGYPMASTLSIVMTTHAQEKAQGGAKSAEASEEKPKEEETPVTEKRDVKSALGGLLKKKVSDQAAKKQEESEKQQAEAAKAQAGTKTVMELTTETQSITTAAVDASSFEIPAGYKKEEVKGLKK